MNLRGSTLLRTQVLLLALFLAAGVGRAAEKQLKLPHMSDVVTLTPPPTLGFVTDVEILPDGRIIVTDGHMTAILKRDGSLDQYLPLPVGSNADTVETNRLIVANSAIVLADSMNDRFIFYDLDFVPRRIVPFGFDVWSLNGFVRNAGSGHLYISAYGSGFLLHQFDAEGIHLGSMIEADPKVHWGASTAILTLDSSDNTLWVSRFDRYEILRVDADGPRVVVATNAAEFKVPNPTQESSLGEKPLTLRVKHALATSVAIGIHSNYVLNTYYVAERGILLTDVFEKDGTPVAWGVPESELVAGKLLADGRVARVFDRTITTWRQR